MVWYASATSLTAPCNPGGRYDKSSETMGNVLKGAVKSSGDMRAFMDCIGEGPLGYDRSWITRYLPGRPGLECPRVYCISASVSGHM